MENKLKDREAISRDDVLSFEDRTETIAMLFSIMAELLFDVASCRKNHNCIKEDK